MRVGKTVLLAAGLASAHLALLNLAILAQGVSCLFWPSLVVRLVLLVVAAPPLGLQGLLDIRMGLAVPSLILFWLYHLAFILCWQRMRTLWTVLKSPPVHTRRALLFGTSALALGSVGIAQGSQDLHVVKRKLPLADLPPQLAGLRVALLADLHRGPAVGQSYLEDVIAVVNDLNPDLVLMPGDFVSKSNHYYQDLTLALKELRPTIGSFATLGNHDHWEGADGCIEALLQAGVIPLQNRSLTIDCNRKIVEQAGQGLCLAGVDDLWTGRPDIDAALKNVPASRPVLLLSHNPDFVETAKECGYRVDLQLSGHTHGGQIVLPGLGPLATASAFGTKYVAGWAEGPRWPVFTTTGVGTSSVPVRIGTQPEVVLFALERRLE
jgi:uncharacterized protein